MAARLRPRHQAEVIEKIRSSQLINALQNHVFGASAGNLSASQVAAALGLLRKVISDRSESHNTHEIRQIDSLANEQAEQMAREWLERASIPRAGDGDVGTAIVAVLHDRLSA